jgi:hypothetical protein
MTVDNYVDHKRLELAKIQNQTIINELYEDVFSKIYPSDGKSPFAIIAADDF